MGLCLPEVGLGWAVTDMAPHQMLEGAGRE